MSKPNHNRTITRTMHSTITATTTIATTTYLFHTLKSDCHHSILSSTGKGKYWGATGGEVLVTERYLGGGGLELRSYWWELLGEKY